MSILKPKLPNFFKSITLSSNKEEKIDLGCFYPDYTSYAAIDRYCQRQTKHLAKDIILASRLQLVAAQEKLWANKKYAVLIVLQGLDTAGKDGIIRHVMSGVNPQGCKVSSFKVPTILESSHDFLWRCNSELPSRGEIVVFNRSYYESVLVTMVHPERIETLPATLAVGQNKNFWKHRYQDINNFEKHLARNATLILKFYLNISKSEQKKRLLERLDDKDKYWKISSSDLLERQFWDKYVLSYEKMLSNTSNDYAPWVIVPSNDKIVARAIIADCIAHAINNLNIEFPKLTKQQLNDLQKAKKELESE